ncbi:MAG: uroporphyrinogen-III synthase [Panacagrimonas sp.]
MKSALTGRRVLVTRPEGQSANLLALLDARGAIVLPLPLHRIEAWGDAELHRCTLAAARGFDGWIFTSANAVRQFASLSPAVSPSQWPAFYAIGAATARALEECGHPDAQLAPAGNTSEALLDLPALCEPYGQRWLICTGAGGRDVLATTLAARGARVERLELYLRVPIDHPAETLTTALDQAEAVIVTSGEGLQRLYDLAPAASRVRLLACPLVAPSARVLEQARRLGFTSMVAPAEMSDAALVASLERVLA